MGRKVMMHNNMTERELRNLKKVRKYAAEGIVLLENDGVLPFGSDVKQIALFGGGARCTVKGGGGSGDVNVRSFTTIEQGLKKAGYHIVSAAWLDEYSSTMEAAKAEYDSAVKKLASEQGPQAALFQSMSNPFHEPDFRILQERECCEADAAVYVLSRNSGEGADRSLSAGDYYLKPGELHDISLLASRYARFVLLLNVGGVIDMQQLKRIRGIGAMVNISQGGSAFGDAVADVLTGNSAPSGKLTATWAAEYHDYPCTNTFGQQDDVHYEEGIYVGYRYFDTFGVEPEYEFGYGKSYTDFTIDVKQVTLVKEQLQIEVSVRNSGNRYAGKEVVQVYSSAPQGRLEKEYQKLQTFIKTKTLKPGETETVLLSFSVAQMTAYSEQEAAWILEKGEYRIRLGSSSRNTKIAAIVIVPEDIIIEKCRNISGAKDLRLIRKVEGSALSEENVYAGMTTVIVQKAAIAKKVYRYQEKEEYITHAQSTVPITMEDVYNNKNTIAELISQLTTEELANLCVGGARMSMQDFSIIGNAADTIPGAAGETTKTLWDSRKIPSLAMADGPAGIRVNPKYYIKDGVMLKNPAEDSIFKNILPEAALQVDLSGTEICYQYCTALPVAVMLAQTWNEELLKQAGMMIAEEMEEMGIDLWLAPGMNIQRNPLGGRNFEYYSEDPLLSGICAAAITEGVQSLPGKGTTIKHIAANNQEKNRNYNNSHITERTLREIYLKGFEICIRRAKPYAAMTSVNLINGIHAANHYDILTAVLRDEWGFDGLVMTDWGTTSNFGVDVSDKKYDCSSTMGCIETGNDLIMPGSERDMDMIVKAVESGELKAAKLQQCAINILRVAARTGRHTITS